jgi:hypothetical protein
MSWGRMLWSVVGKGDDMSRRETTEAVCMNCVCIDYISQT